MNALKSKSFVSNVAIILAAQIIVKILGMVYRTVIINIDGFGDAGNGYYSAGFQIYTLLLALSSVGIPSAVSKLISESIALGHRDEAYKIFKTSLIIFSALGILLSAALFLLSAPIASHLLKMDGVKYTLAALSPSVFFVCVMSVFRGYFSGINKMEIMSISQVIEQILKSALTVIFVLAAVGKSAETMSAYANFATTAATVFAAVYLAVLYKKSQSLCPLPLKANAERDFAAVSKKILAAAIPISLCSVISAVNRIIDTATLTRGIEAAFLQCIPAHGNAAAIINPTYAELSAEAVRLSGILSKSDTLLNLPLSLNIALATVLVPSVSKSRARKDLAMIKKYINSSFLISAVLIMPCAAGYIAVAKPVYDLIYPNAPLGFELLQLGSISLVFTALNQTLTGALQGIGKMYAPARALITGSILKLLSNIILIRLPQINIYGACIGSIICQAAVFAIEFYSLSKAVPGCVSLKKTVIKPLIACITIGIAAYFIYRLSYGISLSNFKALAATLVFSVLFYSAAVMAIRIFSLSDFEKVPVFGKIINFFSKFIYGIKKI